MQMDADVPPSGLEGEDESPNHSYRLVCIIMHQGISPNCGENLYRAFLLLWVSYFHRFLVLITSN
jgi:hypothetical protein